MTPDRKVSGVPKSPEKKKNPANVLYLSGELTPSPQTIFAYWSLKKLGKLDDLDETSIVPSTSVAAHSEIPGHHIVLPKFDGDSRDYIERITRKVADKAGEGTEAYIIRRISNYLTHCFADQKYPPRKTLEKLGASTLFYDLMTGISVRNKNNHPNALKEGLGLINSYIAGGQDPFKFEDEEVKPHVSESIKELTQNDLETLETNREWAEKVARTGRRVEIEIPVLKKTDGVVEVGETREIHTITVERDGGALELLKGQKLGFAIVGPSNSGKSTVAANLVLRINEFLSKTGSDLTCKDVDFDGKTPDLRGIIEEDFEGFQEEEKTQWTTELATELVAEYLEKSTANINIISMPGGDPDKITEILSLPIDGVMLLVAAETDEEWVGRRNIWREALRRFGVRHADALVRSRLEGEKSRVTGEVVESSITSINWRYNLGKKGEWTERIGGRVVGLDREIVDEPFFDDFARLLVLDILPQKVIDGMNAQIDHLKFLQDQYSE